MFGNKNRTEREKDSGRRGERGHGRGIKGRGEGRGDKLEMERENSFFLFAGEDGVSTVSRTVSRINKDDKKTKNE